ncbi:unnamed protein product [Allacma fusca]|uniref:Uncharacterized protein n=1 Tax=Allacma fusca TaxID=39272 RepID=A0A8J2KM38_9HEXA|nr:unnamed protein product [Allacma fusca]
MHFIATRGKYIVFTGKRSIYVLQTRAAVPRLFVISTLAVQPRIKASKVQRGSIDNVDISRNSKFICATDTDKHVYVYERIGDFRWDFQYFFEMEKRCIKLIFDSRCTSIIFADKCGDVWRSYMTTKTVKSPAKLLSHCSIILDTTITNDNRKLFLCDSDNKVMGASFPETFSFDDYFVGHKSPVVGIALIEQDSILLSVEAEGKLKLWSSSDSKQCIDTYDIFTACHGPARHLYKEGKVCSTKVTEALDRIWIVAKIYGSKEMPVLKLRYLTREMCKVSQVQTDSEFCDMMWNHESLYVYSPESTCAIKKFDVTEHGLVSDSQFNVPKIASYKADLEAFVKFNKSTYIASLQRLSSTDLLTSDNDSCNQEKSLHDLSIEFADEEEVTTYEEAEEEGTSAPD